MVSIDASRAKIGAFSAAGIYPAVSRPDGFCIEVPPCVIPVRCLSDDFTTKHSHIQIAAKDADEMRFYDSRGFKPI